MRGCGLLEVSGGDHNEMVSGRILLPLTMCYRVGAHNLLISINYI